MKKVYSIIIIGVIIIGGFSVQGLLTQQSSHKIIKSILYLSEPHMQDISEDYLYVKIPGVTSYLTDSGKPLLPIINKVFTFPFGTKIIDVNIKYKNNSYILSKKISPCGQINVSVKGWDNPLNINENTDDIYYLDGFYPQKSFHMKTSAGLYKNDRMTFLKLTFIPQYHQQRNLLIIPNEIDIEIEYLPPEKPFIINNEYDMMVIAPDIFSDSINPLINHKNSINLPTILKTLEEIYDEYSGRDEAEKIKYCIKDFIENYGINYVLLVGDINILPMRRSKIDCVFINRQGILTDLYYADIYDANSSFCTWDSNENMIFGEYSWNIYTNIEEYIDVIDLYPDVGVGRIPCINNNEVQIVVNKIINYETKAYGGDWLKRILLMGGNCDKSSFDVYEGEWKTEIIGDEMEKYGFIPVKLWASLDSFNPRSINREINNGAGFISYAGHGHESGIATYTPEEKRVAYENYHLLGLLNKEKLPVIYLDACSTGRLDYSYTLYDILPSQISSIIQNIDFLYNIFINIQFSCFGWKIIKQQTGGAIVSICSSDNALDVIRGPLEDLSHYLRGTALLHISFFNNYEEGISISDMFGNSKIDYLNEIIDRGDFPSDPITVEEYNLIGDPSLKIGGYP